jgi:NAD(P)-dependent dehydrogenase (short-subunit alcohol dehydrogenase family)
MDDAEKTGRKALVTAGTRGIGAEVALASIFRVADVLA